MDAYFDLDHKVNLIRLPVVMSLLKRIQLQLSLSKPTISVRIFILSKAILKQDWLFWQFE